MEKINISDLTYDELLEYIENIGEKKFHAKQIFKWIHRENVDSFDDMTDISKSLREKLKENTYIEKLEVLTCQKSKKDGTQKFLIKLPDNNAIESVFMVYNHGNTICVSTQVGCKMGCKFCASTKEGFVRSLLACEIEGQIHTVERYTGQKISNVVYMGIGEPLDNFDNVVKSIKLINDPNGLGIGARHISLSTCGIVPKIKEFADFPYQVNLAISLHAPNDKLRKEIMPIAKAYSLSELMDALNYYIKKTNRRVTFEYILLKDVNDSEENAKELVNLIKGMNAYVNLIPYNATEHLQFSRSNTLNIAKFYDILKKNNICVTIRREFGSKISAACGQLRSKKEEV